MSKLKLFLRCVGEAVCAKGLKALCSLVPMGEFLFEIAEHTYERMREHSQEEQLAAFNSAAAATPDETKRSAEAVAAEVAAQQVPPLPPDAQLALASYLAQVPSAVRQTMKRPADPTGKTVPPSFTLKKADQLVTMLPTRLPSLKPGDRPAGVGNWELVELLGAGGFGEVWLARNPSLHGLTAALKFCLDPQAASFLRHEATLLDQLMRQSKHPGIVTLRQAYLDATPLCLEYEYVNGGDLAALLAEWQRGGKVPRKQVNALMMRLAEIVGHAHRSSPIIVHRDLKPANILVERDNKKIRLRVTDFGIGGIAAKRDLELTKRGGTKPNQIMATSLRGAHTPNYASPQQVRGDAPDPRDDVHALGVIWYQMLTGDLTTCIPSDWITELKDLGQEQELIDLLGQCVASKPEKRLADARVLAERLDAILNPKPAVLEAVAVKEVEEVIMVAELVVEPPKPPKPTTPTQQPRTPPSAPAPVTQRPRSRPPEDEEVYEAQLAEPSRPAPRAPVTQRPPVSTQRPQETQRPPLPRPPSTQRPPIEDRPPSRSASSRPPAEGRPPSRPASSRPPAPQPGNQYRRFYAPSMSVSDVTRELQDWLRGESFDCQDLRTEQGGVLIQVRQQGGWRALVGMQTALNVILYKDGDEITVEIGAGQWLDKAAAGVVSLFVLWPLAVTAAIGAWNQMKMPERIFGRVTDLVGRRPARPTAVLAPEVIAQLRELALLRDEGIITEEEFLARKERLLEG